MSHSAKKEKEKVKWIFDDPEKQDDTSESLDNTMASIDASRKGMSTTYKKRNKSTNIQDNRSNFEMTTILQQPSSAGLQ